MKAIKEQIEEQTKIIKLFILIIQEIYRITSITFLNGTIGRPTIFGFPIGNVELMIFHSLSEIFVMVGLFLFLCRLKETRFHKD
jgi:hypothetical protein